MDWRLNVKIFVGLMFYFHWWLVMTAAKLIRATFSVTYSGHVTSPLSQSSSRSDWKYYSATKTTDWHHINILFSFISKHALSVQIDSSLLYIGCHGWRCGFILQCVQPQTSRNRNLRERQSSVAGRGGTTNTSILIWSKLNLTRKTLSLVNRT